MASSSISLWMPLLSLSSSARVLGSMAKVMAGSANVTCGYWIGARLVAQRVAGQGLFQFRDGANVAGVQFVDRDGRLALHGRDVRELFGACCG